VIELEGAEIQTQTQPKPKKYFFELATPARTYYLYTDTKFDYDDWMHAINTAIHPEPKKTQYKPMPSFDDLVPAVLSSSPPRLGGSISPGTTPKQSFVGRRSYGNTKNVLSSSPVHTRPQTMREAPKEIRKSVFKDGPLPDLPSNATSSTASNGGSQPQRTNTYQTIPDFVTP
jgi:hypothetical protein